MPQCLGARFYNLATILCNRGADAEKQFFFE
jgi:hypothetical protein